MANLIKVDIVSASTAIWSGEARQVSVRTVEGEIGILAGHEPLLGILADGTVRVTTSSGEQVVVLAHNGFVSVDHDTVTVVAPEARLDSDAAA